MGLGLCHLFLAKTILSVGKSYLDVGCKFLLGREKTLTCYSLDSKV